MNSGEFRTPLIIYLDGFTATATPTEDDHISFVHYLHLTLRIGTKSYDLSSATKYSYELNELLLMSERYADHNIKVVTVHNSSFAADKNGTMYLDEVKLTFSNVMDIISDSEVGNPEKEDVISKIVTNYLVYRHFKTKGYILKDGLKYGADFIVYKLDPELSHSLYTILICNFNEYNAGDYCEVLIDDMRYKIKLRVIDWKKIISLARLCESVSKGLLLVNYNFDENSVESVQITRFK
ncbi:tRNA-intron endonuclease [Cryptosporidium ryanae]|uniref:tRNA-intron endonuclease n=1 Tax=Cryptosporidium ryanae TaxID=515981 RepID=UPI00351A9E27|nr:tRNA-intron endonuclease [Cryptosporidium ryanae]